MSECKKTCGNCAGLIRSVLSKDRCDMTNKPIENYSSTCKDWEPNRETEVVMQKDELKSLRQERDELQAQVAVLRGALERVADGVCEGTECEEVVKVLQTTPAEAAERVQKLVEALEEVEKMGTYKNADFTSEDSQEEPWAVIAGNALSEWRRDK